MTNIKIIASGASITAVASGKLTSGMVGVPVLIEYDNAWNGLIKTAVFRVGNFSRDRQNVGTSTTVPWEVMRHHGKPLMVGIEGRDTDGKIVMPTVWAAVATILPGANSTIPGAPNPDYGEIPGGGGSAIDDSVISTTSTWSSQNTVDKLCPPIHESGTVVQCEPVEGYPMVVTVDEASVPCEITLCGKNLYNPIKYPLVDGYYINKGSGSEAGLGDHAEYCATRTYIPVAHLRGKKINLNYIPGGNSPGMAFYDAEKVRTDPSFNGKGDNITVPDDAVYMKFSTFINKKNEVQIELGSVATTYEPYAGTSIAVEDSEVEVTARSGVNTIYALAENAPVNIEVMGRADPVAIIEKLTNAIISLGNNV